MRIAQLALLSLVIQSLAAGVDAQAPATTKVESQVVATGEAGMQFMVSPRGAHLAVVTQKGSRPVVLVDGVPGPLFDQIMSNVSFSPDGSRYAYVARSGAEQVVIVDGKEQLRLPFSNESQVSFIRGINTAFAFSPDSKHLVYLIQTVGPGPNGAKFREYHVVFDGTVGPPDHGDGPAVAFSADGARHAYLITARARTALNPGQDNKSLLVVDGKLAPYTAGALQFTADGTHLFSQRTMSLGAGKGAATEVLVDGRPTMRVLAIWITMAPVGHGFVGVVQQQAPGGAINYFLVVGGTKVPGSDCPGSSWTDVSMSPDGKHFAAKCQTPANTVAMLIDGKRGPEYQSISDFTWAPDGSRAMYKGRQGQKVFVVTGDTESDGYQAVDSLRFGAGGKRTAFIVTKASGGPYAVVIDGKPIPRSDNVQPTQFGFSPDGLRWACLGGHGYGDVSTLVVDGVDQQDYTVHPFGRSHSGPDFVFSPDGKHIVSPGMPKTNPSEANAGLFIDGRYLRLGTTATVGATYVYHPTFTPDGRHLVFLAEDGGAQRQALYVDGKAVAQVEANTSLSDSPGAWDLGADGVLTFLAQDAGSVKRFKVTLGSDTSIESLLALAKKP